MLRAPKFWFRKKNEINIPSLLLTPLSKCWDFLIKRRMRLGSWEKMPLPVICVGNIIIGGAGKTPVTQALQTLLNEMGLEPHVVSKGYRGKVRKPTYVSATSDFSDVGDEPILLSKTGPVWIAKNRTLGIRKAWENGAKVVLLDDGFQNTGAAKDLSLVVVDAKILFGNERSIPAGPLREPVSSGLSRADAIILVNHDASKKSKKPDFDFPKDLPIINAIIKPHKKLLDWAGKRVVAFSGIAHPEKFRVTLDNLNCEVVSFNNFPDHYPYKKGDIEKLKTKAKNLNANLVTTEKDFIRIPSSQHEAILTIPIQIEFENKTILKKILQEKLQKDSDIKKIIPNLSR